MVRIGLLWVLLIAGIGRPASAQAPVLSPLDSVRVAFHPFCQWGRCPPYFMVLRASGELTLAQDSARTAIQLADSVATHLLTLVHPVMASTLPERIADSRILCDVVRSHQREVTIELFSRTAVRRVVDANGCQDTGRNGTDGEGWHPIFRKLRLFEAEIESLPNVSTWLKH